MDLIEPEFRPRYEKICVGNKPANAQDVFFEGMLLEEGLGKRHIHPLCTTNRALNRRADFQFQGQDQPWYGNSSWGHPDYDRKSVRHAHGCACIRY